MLRTRSIRRLPAAAAVAVAAAFLTTAPVRATDAPRYPAEPGLIEVMFAPESQVRLRGERLVDLAGDALAGVDEALAGVPQVAWQRFCDVPEATLDDIAARGRARTGRSVYDLNNIHRLAFDPSRGAPDVWTLAARLEALPGIHRARPVPLPMPLPLPPDYDPSQNYHDAASSTPAGIGARFAWTQAGGDGTGITICDLEYSWNTSHADLTKAAGSQINTNVADPFSDTNHGTAVLGELISDVQSPNWGTIGGAYGASILTCGTYYGAPSPSWNVPGAIAVAMANLNAGDVILLEQQWDYTGGNAFVPVEWWTDSSPSGQSLNAVYAAIQNAVAAGIHVVEAGGNGNVDTGLLTWFGDSGAIIVGAGGAYPGGTYPQGNLERLSFSSYGPRFDLQGWGENVVTTGYGTLYNAMGVNYWYTSSFSGTSSASPNVASAVACCQGYWLANLSATPMAPSVLRSLLASTGTPQVFGLAGNIGPRPDCAAAIAAMQAQQTYEYGDAPEGAVAYPATGVPGMFPTCTATGAPGSFIRHGNTSLAWLGTAVDFETDGNAGNCPLFPPYDADECWNDGDAGLLFPPAWTIDAALNVVPCTPGSTGCLGMPCATLTWGVDVDILVASAGPPAILNVLMDWDHGGTWGGSSMCPGSTAPEHVLINFPIPAGYAGPLSALMPPPFIAGPVPGPVWTRFTISDVPVGAGWNGSGVFLFGETSDYLLCLEEEQFSDFGDAPEGALAYPAAGVMGAFPTCVAGGPAGFVAHASTGNLFLGPSVDVEVEGNAGNCALFPPYDADECQLDGDAGLLFPPAYTIDAFLNVVPCTGAAGALGLTCRTATWGQDLDLQVTNVTASDAFVNVLLDWNRDGLWGGTSPCPAGSAPEHALVDFVVPPGFSGPLSALSPPPFTIGPQWDFVWSRFTITPAPVGVPWDGSGSFGDGETSDYLLEVQRDVSSADDADGPVLATRLLPVEPNPFGTSATVRFELRDTGPAKLTVYDVTGRRVRALAHGVRPAGRHAVTWDGRDEAGRRVASGTYFVRLEAGGKGFHRAVVRLH